MLQNLQPRMDGWRSGKPDNVKQFSVAGEDGEVNTETLESWAERLPEIVKDYELKDMEC